MAAATTAERAPKSRRLDVAWVPLPEDQVRSTLPSWRDGLLTDWTLRLGTRTVSVHRLAVGFGQSSSAFLHRTFTTEVGAGAAETDLSALLPESCWPLLDQVLDFIYHQQFEAEPQTVVRFLRWADSLQIKLLHECALAACEELLTPRHAPELLLEVHALFGEGSVLHEQIMRESRTLIAEHFEECDWEAVSCLPLSDLLDILCRDGLRVLHEDATFDFLKMATEGRPSEEASKLWRTCRLGALSATRSLEAATSISGIPAGAAHWAALHFGREAYPLHDWVTAASLVPRTGIFSGLCCAVIFSSSGLGKPT